MVAAEALKAQIEKDKLELQNKTKAIERKTAQYKELVGAKREREKLAAQLAEVRNPAELGSCYSGE